MCSYAQRCSWQKSLLTPLTLITAVQNLYDDHKRGILRSARVVGMTTTGAAMHQGLLAGLNSRIALVEEAGEVLEAHILSSLSASHQQLVLIGDHYQLRPKTQACQWITCWSWQSHRLRCVGQHARQQLQHSVLHAHAMCAVYACARCGVSGGAQEISQPSMSTSSAMHECNTVM